MDVSIVIVNYNTCNTTIECIESIFKHTQDISIEVIIVDNASGDGSKEVFSNDTRVKYVYSYENMGFGRANNVGMMLSEGKYIFLLNSDTLLVNNAIKEFYDYAENHGKLAFWGCWLEDIDGNHTFSGDTVLPNAYSLLAKEKWFKRNKINTVFHSDEECTEMGFISGAAMFFNRKVYEIEPGFDHRFFMYYEETDWQKRCKEHGIKSYIISTPRIVHLEGGSQNRKKGVRKPASFQRIFKSRCLYVKKYEPLYRYIYFRIMYIILCAPRILFGHTASRTTTWPMFKVLFK